MSYSVNTVTWDFSDLQMKLDDSKQQIEGARRGVNKINTRLRYNLLQWRQIISQALSMFGDQVWAQKLMEVVQWSSLVDLERRLFIEQAAQMALPIPNPAAAWALRILMVSTAALQFASSARSARLDRIDRDRANSDAAMAEFNTMVRGYRT